MTTAWTYDVGASDSVLKCLIASAGSRELLDDPAWNRFADAFLVEAIEAGIVDAESYIGSARWAELVDEFGRD